MNKPIAASLVALSLAATACPQIEEIEDDNAQAPGAVLVVTSDYQSGAYSVVDADTLASTSSIQSIHPDAVCRFDPITGTPFVLTRMGGDAVEILDPQNSWAVAKEYSVGAGSNPHDLAVASEQLAYVTLFGVPELLVVNPLSGEELARVDLAPYADADGNPEAEGAVHHEGKVYVTLQRLDPSFTPEASGGLVVVDAATSQVEKALDLSAGNPTGRLRHSDEAGGIVLIESGLYGVLDGGVEIYDPSTGQLSGLIATEQSLGGDVVDVVIASPSVGYAVIGTTEGTTSLVSFDPASGKKQRDLIVSSGWDLYYLELDPDGEELWVADRTPKGPGIRIFDTTSGEELTDEPIGVGLPPFMVCFTDAGQ